jgi:hypothetical protein
VKRGPDREPEEPREQEPNTPAAPQAQPARESAGEAPAAGHASPEAASAAEPFSPHGAAPEQGATRRQSVRAASEGVPGTDGQDTGAGAGADLRPASCDRTSADPAVPDPAAADPAAADLAVPDPAAADPAVPDPMTAERAAADPAAADPAVPDPMTAARAAEGFAAAGSAEEDSAADPGGAGGAEPPSPFGGSGGSALDEDALRAMLHGAVGGLQPAPGALDHLRAAVPARRARKRQAMVGVAAAVLLVGTAVPAFLHVAGARYASGDRTVAAGHDEQISGSPTSGEGTVGSGGRGAQLPGDEPPSGKDVLGGSADPRGTQTGSPGDGSASTPPGKSFGLLSLPACAPDQLGVSAGQQPPTRSGTVYGTFHVANVSDTACSVDDPGTINYAAEGAADAARISVVQHTAGDPAGQLPLVQSGSTLQLQPGTGYDVRFAFVPSDTCPVKDAGSPDPTPSDAGSPQGDASTGADGASTGGASDGEAAQGHTADGGGVEGGSVAVSHTPASGAPAAETTIANACAGTIYKTGPESDTQK